MVARRRARARRHRRAGAWSPRRSSCSTRVRPAWPRSTRPPTRSWSTPGSRRRSCCCSGSGASRRVEVGPFEYADKLPLKTGYEAAGVRVVPGASARWGSFIDRGAILMPSYVNIGARVGAGTLVDTWATVASCAQIGEHVHLSGGVGIGGVLEPPERRAGDGRRPRLHREPLHGHRRGPGGRGRRARRGHDPQPVDPGDRRRHGRGARPRAWSRRGASPSSASRRREFPGGEFFLPCVLVIKRLEPGRAPRQGPARVGAARPPGRHVSASGLRRDRPAGLRRRARRHPLGQPRRGGAGRPGRARPAPVRASAGGAHRRHRGGPDRARAGRRVLLGGHLDTVPPFDGGGFRIEGDTLWGLGAVDMKGGLAVLLDLARGRGRSGGRRDLRPLRLRGGRAPPQRARACWPRAPGARSPPTPPCCASPPAAWSRPAARARCGRWRRLGRTPRPHGAPVGGRQRRAPAGAAAGDAGRLRAAVGGPRRLRVRRAAPGGGGRGWRRRQRRPRPCAASTVNHRFAPDRDAAAAEAELRAVAGRCASTLSAGDRLEVVDAAPGAPPALGHPVLAALVGGIGRAGPGQAGVDRRGHLLGGGDPGGQLRPGRPTAGPHPGRARVARRARGGACRARRRWSGPRPRSRPYGASGARRPGDAGSIARGARALLAGGLPRAHPPGLPRCACRSTSGAPQWESHAGRDRLAATRHLRARGRRVASSGSCSIRPQRGRRRRRCAVSERWPRSTCVPPRGAPAGAEPCSAAALAEIAVRRARRRHLVGARHQRRGPGASTSAAAGQADGAEKVHDWVAFVAEDVRYRIAVPGEVGESGGGGPTRSEAAQDGDDLAVDGRRRPGRAPSATSTGWPG